MAITVLESGYWYTLPVGRVCLSLCRTTHLHCYRVPYYKPDQSQRLMFTITSSHKKLPITRGPRPPKLLVELETFRSSHNPSPAVKPISNYRFSSPKSGLDLTLKAVYAKIKFRGSQSGGEVSNTERAPQRPNINYLPRIQHRFRRIASSPSKEPLLIWSARARRDYSFSSDTSTALAQRKPREQLSWKRIIND